MSENSRIFIEKKYDDTFKAIPKISVNAAFTKMDSRSHPLLDIYCEDKESEKIIKKGINLVEKDKSLINFSQLINIVVSGSAEQTYENFLAHRRTFDKRTIRCGYGCILDGDMRNLKDRKGNLTYPPEDYLHFLYSNEAPEFFLIRMYLKNKPNKTIEYHLNNSNPHCLFDKVLENSEFNSHEELFETSWGVFSKRRRWEKIHSNIKRFSDTDCEKISSEL